MSELVVLLSESGAAIGTAAKATVHHASTPLHLAFSCYVFSDDDELLVTRRSTAKHTWPGVWTNSLCGHPGPDEDVAAACVRRAADELGLALRDVRLVLPGYRYRAVMPDGVVENEMCPVLTARADSGLSPDPAEVEGFEWLPWADFRASVLSGAREVSPWCTTQVAALPEDLPTAAPGDPALLPLALQPARS